MDDNNQSVIEEPHDHDVICGRGGKVNAHPGNRRFRSLVNERKEQYTRASGKGDKTEIAQSILTAVQSQSPPGRVLEYDSKTGKYTEVPFKRAMSKTTQALREGAPELRKLKGLPSPKEAGKKNAPLSAEHCRPKVVHIKTTGGFLYNEAEHEYDASSSSSGSVESGQVTMKVSYDEHSGGASGFSHAQAYRSGEYYREDTGLPNKKPRIVGATSSDEESTSKAKAAVASPPIGDSASLLYALATQCAKQAPSVESPPASGQEDAPTNKLSTERLVTPETGRGSSRSLWAEHNSGAVASISTSRSYPSHASLSSSAVLSPSESIRLEKEKTVQSFLITSLPCIYLDDLRTYTRQLVDDGFDSVEMLMTLREEDLGFAKKAHKRALLRVIQDAGSI